MLNSAEGTQGNNSVFIFLKISEFTVLFNDVYDFVNPSFASFGLKAELGRDRFA